MLQSFRVTWVTKGRGITPFQIRLKTLISNLDETTILGQVFDDASNLYE